MRRIRFSPNELKKIKKNKEMLEKKLNLQITIEEDDIIVQGDQYDEYMGAPPLEALSLGFSINDALSLLNEDKQLNVIEMKDYVKEHSLSRVKARIIGKGGKAKRHVEELTNTKISIHDNRIGIIGNYDDVDLAVDALMRLIHGSPHSNVYRYIEKKIHQRIRE